MVLESVNCINDKYSYNHCIIIICNSIIIFFLIDMAHLRNFLSRDPYDRRDTMYTTPGVEVLFLGYDSPTEFNPLKAGSEFRDFH